MIMENKINIAELLKDCPEGMELDCTMFENVTFEGIKQDEYPIIVKLKKPNMTLSLTETGGWNLYDSAKCVIFPRGKTTWEGFQRPFKEGDIVVYDNPHRNNLQVFIFKNKEENNALSTCYLMLDGDELDLEEGMYYITRLATEEEKQKLFDAIKENGYKWNEETKTLEKLIKPWTIQDAKNGDVLAFNDETIVIFKDLYNKTSFHSYCHIEEGIFTISKKDMPDWWEGRGFYPATEEQCDFLFQKIKEAGYKWNSETKTLEKLPKFKVGDRIRKEDNNSRVYTINGVYSSMYGVEERDFGISIEEQDEYELVPNKFDITTLVPFESRVLVRNSDNGFWQPTFWGIYEAEKSNEHQYRNYLTTKGFFRHCIPYNDDTKHLIGTTNDCTDFYKTW